MNYIIKKINIWYFIQAQIYIEVGQFLDLGFYINLLTDGIHKRFWVHVFFNKYLCPWKLDLIIMLDFDENFCIMTYSLRKFKFDSPKVSFIFFTFNQKRIQINWKFKNIWRTRNARMQFKCDALGLVGWLMNAVQYVQLINCWKICTWLYLLIDMDLTIKIHFSSNF